MAPSLAIEDPEAVTDPPSESTRAAEGADPRPHRARRPELPTPRRRTPPSTATIVGGAGSLVAGIRLLGEAGSVLTSSGTELAARLPDDAFYYLVVARSLAVGDGPTFDRVHPTNGFHPLWQWTTAALAAVWEGTALVRAALVLQLLLVAATWALLVSLVASPHRQVRWLAAGAIGVVLTVPPAMARIVDGMETAVVMATTAALVCCATRYQRQPALRTATAVGVVTAAAALARLSALPVLAGAAAVVVIAARCRRRPIPVGHLVAASATAVVAMAPWALCSWATVGQLTPVSAQVKLRVESQLSAAPASPSSISAAVSALNEELVRQVDLLVPWHLEASSTAARRGVMLAVLATLVAAVGVLIRRRRDAAVLTVLVPGALVTIRVLGDVVAVPRSVATWYGAPLAIATSSGAAVAAIAIWRTAREVWRPPARPVRRWLFASAAISLTAGLVLQPAAAPSGDWGRANAEAASAIAGVDPIARVGAFDAGVVGWLAPGTRNLDGLVREPGFVRRWPPGSDVAAMLRAEQIDLLVDVESDGRIPRCARRLWHSSVIVDRPDGATHVGLFDVSTC